MSNDCWNQLQIRNVTKCFKEFKNTNLNEVHMDTLGTDAAGIWKRYGWELQARLTYDLSHVLQHNINWQETHPSKWSQEMGDWFYFSLK